MAILLTADEIDRLKQDTKFVHIDGEKIPDSMLHER